MTGRQSRDHATNVKAPNANTVSPLTRIQRSPSVPQRLGATAIHGLPRAHCAGEPMEARLSPLPSTYNNKINQTYLYCWKQYRYPSPVHGTNLERVQSSALMRLRSWPTITVSSMTLRVQSLQ